jgi:hypothetical protein
VSDLRACQAQVPGYPRTVEPQVRDHAGLLGVRALEERHDHGGPSRPPGAPLPALLDTVVLGHTRAQIHAAPVRKRIPQLTLR